MRIIRCTQCGGNDFNQDNGYMICKFCNAKYAIEKEDIGIRTSSIELDSDIETLLNKCRKEPRNAKKYANLILDIDPNNKDALRYL